MASEKLILTIPEQIFKKVKEEKEKFSYSSVQQVIIDILRDKYLKEMKKEKRGRPKKLDEMKILTRKKIFGEDGEIVKL